MNDCTNAEIRDALPDLIHGKLGAVDNATVLAHVASCEACAAELAVLREVRASAAFAPSIDVAKVVSALPLRASVNVVPGRWSTDRFVRPALAIAAAAAILLTGVLLFSSGEVQVADSRLGQPVAPAAVVAEVPVPEADNADPATAEPRPAPTSEAAALSLVAGVQELTDAELETLIAELDGIDSVPSEEPLPLSPVGDFEAES